MADRRIPTRSKTERNSALADRFARENWSAMCRRARIVGAHADAIEDVVQEALASFIQAFPGPDEIEPAWRYLLRCVSTAAHHAARRHTRKESHNVGIESLGLPSGYLVDVDAGDPAERALDREAMCEAVEQLAALTEAEREVLALGAAGFGHAEIAARIGCSQRAVRKRVGSARRKLADQPR